MRLRQRRSDRKRLAWITAYFGVGLLLLGAALLWSNLVEPHLPDSSGSEWGYGGRRSVATGLGIAGVVVLLLGAGELAHRVWFGAQKPGRHTRDER
ncbi:hypothetical protein SAMN05421671_5304 [Pimelobacter simplex]|nr:hypothetical protein SAMN05421671_5304 [Pimelobacter simplex]